MRRPPLNRAEEDLTLPPEPPPPLLYGEVGEVAGRGGGQKEVEVGGAVLGPKIKKLK